MVWVSVGAVSGSGSLVLSCCLSCCLCLGLSVSGGLVLSLVVILLGFISVVLISNLIRLNIYASRFSIHTMQLVGASNSFIARPFLKRSALLGSLSGLLSCLIIAALFYYVHSIFPQIFELFQIDILLEVALGLIVLGIIICLLCTRIVLGKVVKLDKDELYG